MFFDFSMPQIIKKFLFLYFLIIFVFVGTILYNNSATSEDIFATCRDSADVSLCRQEYVVRVLQTNGVKRAFEEIEKLKKSDSKFAPSCHSFAHTIGVAAYPLLLRGKQVFQIPISDCEWGYFHGLMTEVVMHKGDLNYASDYCKRLEKYSRGDKDVVDQCYHGIGHGLPLYFASNNSQKTKDIVNLSLQACDKFFNGQPECKHGVFGGISTLFVGDHGLKLTDAGINQIFITCNTQDGDLKSKCYEMMAPALMFLTNDNINLAIGLSNKNIPGRGLASMASALGMAITTSVDNPTIPVVVGICRHFKENTSPYCLEGYIRAFVGLKNITDFNSDILSFCSSILLTEDESSQCRQAALSQASGNIPPDDFSKLCSTLTQKEREVYCNK